MDNKDNNYNNENDNSVAYLRKTDPDSAEALALMDELSDYLEALTGSSGRSSYYSADFKVTRSLFITAYNQKGEAIGCGAIRPLDEQTAEVKRMYAMYKGSGIGRAILTQLEIEAKNLGYKALRLETRLINKTAVLFYEALGYHQIENYGKYTDNEEAVCFEKCIDK